MPAGAVVVAVGQIWEITTSAGKRRRFRVTAIVNPGASWQLHRRVYGSWIGPYHRAMTWPLRALEDGMDGAVLVSEAPPATKPSEKPKLVRVSRETKTPRAKTMLPRMDVEEQREVRQRAQRLAERGLPVPRIAEALCLSEAATRAILGAA